MKRTSVITTTAVAVILAISGYVFSQPAGAKPQKAGKLLVKSLPTGIQGVELAGGAVRVKSGFKWVKQPNGTVTVARMGGGGGLGIGGTWSCGCDSSGDCGSRTDGTELSCTASTCKGKCVLHTTTSGGKIAIMMY